MSRICYCTSGHHYPVKVRDLLDDLKSLMFGQKGSTCKAGSKRVMVVDISVIKKPSNLHQDNRKGILKVSQ